MVVEYICRRTSPPFLGSPGGPPHPSSGAAGALILPELLSPKGDHSKVLIDIYGCNDCGGTFYVSPGDTIEGQVSCPYCLSSLAFFEGKATIASADFTQGLTASLSGPVIRSFLSDEGDDRADVLEEAPG